MAENSVLDAVGRRFGEGFTSWLTGEPPAGSTAAMEKELYKRQLQEKIDQFERNPNDPDAQQALLRTATTLQEALGRGQRQSNRNTLEFLSSPELAKAAQTKLDLQIQGSSADTDNKLREYGALHGQRKDIMSMLQNHEMAVRGGSQADLHDKTFNFLEKSHDKNLAAQKASASTDNVRLLLGSLLGGASLFA